MAEIENNKNLFAFNDVELDVILTALLDFESRMQMLSVSASIPSDAVRAVAGGNAERAKELYKRLVAERDVAMGVTPRDS